MTSTSKMIPIDEAVGTILAHDITEIKPGVFKGPAFRKGHQVRPEDLEHLKKLGKQHLFVLKNGPDEVHEDDAAIKLASALAGRGVEFTASPVEGKIILCAAFKGLLKVHTEALIELCSIPEISCASRHNNTVVERSDPVAATRVIPLQINSGLLDRAVSIAVDAKGVFAVKPVSPRLSGLVITGNEVYSGLIKDSFAPVLRGKLEAYGCEVMDPVFCPDDVVAIRESIGNFIERKAGIVLVGGGMSVDPDDVSRRGIAEAGATDVVYGTNVFPGAMFLYSRIGAVPVLGVPACAIYFRTTVLDILLPRVLAGEIVNRLDLAKLAHGGLCLGCDECVYPVCPLGK